MNVVLKKKIITSVGQFRVAPCLCSSIHQGEMQLLQRCLQKLGQLPKVSHWFCSSVGSLWADGCGFRNHVGAPGFGKTCLLSFKQCRASDFCWQLSSHVCCHSLSSLLRFTCYSFHLSFLWSFLDSPQGGSSGNKMTILSAVTYDLQICLSF